MLMDSGQLQSCDKYGSGGVPFAGQIAKIKPPEQQIQQMIDAIVPAIQCIIDAIVPLIEQCAGSIKILWDEVLKAYPDKRIVYLAFYHKKAKVRKKNLNRIVKHLSKAVRGDG